MTSSSGFLHNGHSSVRLTTCSAVDAVAADVLVFVAFVFVGVVMSVLVRIAAVGAVFVVSSVVVLAALLTSSSSSPRAGDDA